MTTMTTTISDTDIQFQIISWYARDFANQSEDDDDDDSEGDYDEQQRPPPSKYLIKVFGRTEEGVSVSLNITDFKPFFFIKLPRAITQKDKDSFLNFIGRYRSSVYDVQVVQKKNFWGFSNNQIHWFLKFIFHNHRSLKMVERIFSSSVQIRGFKRQKFQIFESNVDPFLRFIHKKNISPTGWIRVAQSKVRKDLSVLPSTCKMNLATKWTNVFSVDSTKTAPFVVASFDIECTSSHGDFPVPKKTYVKTCRELLELYNTQTNAKLPPMKVRDVIGKCLLSAFDTSRVASDRRTSISRVFLKEPMAMEEIKERIDNNIQDIMLILKGNVMFENLNPEDTAAVLNAFGDPADDAGDEGGGEGEVENAFEHMARYSKYANNPAATKNSNDMVIIQLNKMLSNLFPAVEGDPIIQIGMVVQKTGTMVFEKYMINLGTCTTWDDTKVIECVSERDLLIAWAKLVRKVDPDIMTGYNIFGFDMWYIVERAKEVGCLNELLFVGRLRDERCEYVERNLSSSALGDNVLKMIQMDGRVLIDLMKVVQRDHKLDSYKLDNVANNFIKGKVVNHVWDEAGRCHRLKLNSTNGLQVGNYIKLADGNKYRLKTIDYTTNQVTIGEKVTVVEEGATPWGLSKDDISPKQIFDSFVGSADDRALIAKYCIQDCMLCNFLMMKLQILANNFGMANVCSVPLAYIFLRGQGIKIFSLVLKQCTEDGFLIPVVRKKEDEDNEGYEGAIVLDPIPGIYIEQPVSVLDYASLYPSSMISENISHDSIVLDEKYDNLPGYDYVDITFDVYEGKADKKKKIGEQTCRYAQFPGGEKGVIPRILMKLLAQRKATRKKIEEKVVTMKSGDIFQGLVTQEEDTCVTLMVPATKDTFRLSREETVSIKDAYDDFQKAVLDGLQLAYKVTANSVYGQVGAPTSQIYMKELAASTTATGRNLILSAKHFLEEKCDGNVVYGDSVMPYTPVLVRSKVTRQITAIAIENLSDSWMPYDGFKAGESNRRDKEQCLVDTFQAWTDQGWADIKRVVRHKCPKKIYRVVTHTSVVDVTEDHSLLLPNRVQVKPHEVEVGTQLLHSFPDVFEDQGSITCDPAYTQEADGWLNTQNQVTAQQYYLLLKRLGYTVSLNIRDDAPDVIRLTWTRTKQQREATSIKKLGVLHEQYDGFVYDIETSQGVFQAGVGEIIVKNTDSVFVVFNNKKLVNGKQVAVKGKAALPISIQNGIQASKEFRKLLKAPHDLEYEKTFYPFIILSKKRYVGNLYELDPNKFSQKSMGIVLKRRDNANVVKKVYGGIIDIILNQTDVKKSVEFLNAELQKLVSGEYPLEQLVITKTLKGSYKNPIQIAHKVLADRMRERDPGSAPQTNDRIPYVYIRTDEKKGEKVLQGDRIEHPQFIIDNKLEPDYKFYITNQIMKPVVQLYALEVEQMKGFRKGKDYFKNMETSLAIKDGMTTKKIREKIGREKEREAETILFKPFLLQLENKKNKQSTLDMFCKKN
jgi:DNA polymerase elongation subunit (family B)